jgi:Na+/H+-dicarboxylate symporter
MATQTPADPLASAPTNRQAWLQRYKRVSMHPLTVIACVILGVMLGLAAPIFSKRLDVVGVIYIDLLKMIVLPFMVSAVIFSLQNLFHEGGAAKILGRVALVFSFSALVVALFSGGAYLAVSPGDNLADDTKAALGEIIGSDAQRSNIDMYLRKADETPPEPTFVDVLSALIPSNIFSSLANGDTLKALVFALLFGLAVGQVPSSVSRGLNQTLETVYKACQTLTHWVNLPLPFVLVCLSASQIAETGLGPLQAMAGFVSTFLLICAGLLALAVFAISRRSGTSFTMALQAMREPFAIGIATNNAATCMPAMIEAMADLLGYVRARVELVVPLAVSLLRVGAVAYFVCATLFVADLYGRTLGVVDVSLVIVIAVLAGFASSGMAGIVTVALVGTICKYLNLPFEAAFILFVAVDPICAMGRTALTVITGCAAVAAICPKQVTRP